MRTGRWFILIAALAMAAGCVAEAPDVGTYVQELGGGPHGSPDDGWVDDADVEELPPCANVEVEGDADFYAVAGSGGLYAVEQDGELLCVDDLSGLREAGITDEPEIELGDDGVVDGTPLPAREPPPADGTPLPAGGATLVTDGTPLPANANK